MITRNFSIRGGKKTGSPITTFGDDDQNYLQIRHSGMLLAGDSVDFDPKRHHQPQNMVCVGVKCIPLFKYLLSRAIFLAGNMVYAWTGLRWLLLRNQSPKATAGVKGGAKFTGSPTFFLSRSLGSKANTYHPTAFI